MKRIVTTILFTCALFQFIQAQTGQEFWLAPPDITWRHNATYGDSPIFLNLTSAGAASTVTVDQPANGAWTPIVINIPANSAVRYDMSAFVNDLETQANNTIQNTGLHITSTSDITAYYENANPNNPDFMALKGNNGLGEEFYIPLHKHMPFYNHDYSGSATDWAYASFDIVATENGTNVMIYSPVDVLGHPALTPFVITLNAGQTYSCANMDAADHNDPSKHPSGAVVLSDKPIAISIKDDSNHNPSGGCYDLMTDQIVPVGIVGTDYIAVKGQLNSNGDESCFLMATENNTQVYIDGSATPVATLFAGQYYRHDMDYLSSSADNATHMYTSKPSYAIHVTGFGCEQGQAILPPLNCAGSRQLSFSRATAEPFYLNLLVRNGSETDFTVTGPGTATIPASAFQIVPGTGGEWMAAQISYNATQVPVNQAFIVSNTSDVFSLAIINGGGSTGCRYGFFSEFAGEILVDAGADQDLCEGDDVILAGSVNGGSTSGEWSSTGSGIFVPSITDFNATYQPSLGDYALGSVTVSLTSTGDCDPVTDDMLVTFQALPIVDAGTDFEVCSNNPSITMNGSVLNAAGGVWSGGTGGFLPSSSSMTATYTPTAIEVASGSITFTLTSTGNGNCPAVSDEVTVTFTPSPTADAGIDETVCANDPAVDLSGGFTIATGGVWSGGAGTFDPSTTNLSAQYTPTAAEIASGSVTLILTTTGSTGCIEVNDQMTITFTDAPTANAGADQTLCENNANISLAGAVTIASGGVWSGGLGTFSTSSADLNSVYTPSAAEIAAGSMTLTLTTTGNGDCVAVSDDVTFTFTPAPTVNAGIDLSSCANDAIVSLSGSVTVATGGVWSGGSGTYSPNNTNLNATYTPSAAEITAGTVTLTLTSAGNGTCSPVTDQITISITDSPVPNAGPNQSICSNNADVTLAGTILNAGGGQWSGGTGSYNPSSTALNAVYSPSAAEIASGSMTLTLTSTSNGDCLPEADNMTVNFTDAPTVSAGVDQTVCENNPSVSLGGSYTIATGVQWTGGLGSFIPNSTTLTAVYTPTATEIAAGVVTLTLTTTGNADCNSVSDDMNINFTSAPTVNAGIDGTTCANNAAVALAGTVTVASSGVWSGGAGTYFPNNTNLNATYTPSAGEISTGSFTLTLTSAGNGNCLAVMDQVTYTVTDAPIANAGPDQTLCANNALTSLSGSISFASGGVWSGGSGSFNPSNTDINASYTPTAAEISAGSVSLTLTTSGNGSCNAASDNITISFTPAPVINAGADQTLCENNPGVDLSGSFTVATGAQWGGGLGTFSPSNTDMNATYTPTIGEVASGSLTLTLTSTGNGSCTAVMDQMTVTFTGAPVSDAGADLTVCANNPVATLNGSVSVATGGVWSGGAGSFSPNNTTLNASYTPSAGEIASGSVTLTLTTAGNGNCLPVTDQVVINISPSPIVNAGTAITACANNPTASLAGSVSNATGGIWSGGLGTFNPSATDVSATYTPTAGEIASGSITLTLTSSGNGTCNAVSDIVVISITDAPIVSAGIDQTICSNNADVTLAASVSNASGGQWSGGLGVFSPSVTDPGATYSPTATEIASGILTLTYTSTGNGTCNSESDDMTIVFTAAPTVDAGADEVICENNLNLVLAGTVGIATGGLWSGGTGVFSPNNSTLNATYTPSATEIALGTVTLTLTSTGNGNCNSVSDNMTVSILPSPEADAGGDVFVCSNNAEAQLGGSINGAGGGIWSGGLGTFVPASTALNAIYYPTPAEVATGSLTMTLTTIGNGDCDAVSDQMTITFTTSPTANAGTDDSYCVNNADIQLNGSVVVASGAQWSGGGGTFTPNSTALNAVYTPDAGELAFGSVTLVLTTTGNGNCNAVSDDVTFTFTDAPEVNAGIDLSSCANNANVTLDGSVTIAAGGLWSGGTGTFSPNNSTLNAEYTPSAGEITAGSVTLTLTSFGNGLCNEVTDDVVISIGPSPIANAGPDQNVAANNPDANLAGNVTNATGGMWSGGTGTFNPDATTLGAVYTPSNAEIIAGSVTLTLTTTGNGNCNSESDQVTLSIGGAPTADAGADQTVCENNAAATLNGSVTIASGGAWSGGLGVFTPDNTDLNAVYTPTTTELLAGSVTLTLTTTGNGVALPETNQMTILFTEAPTVEAGAGINVCENQAVASLSGTVTIASGGVWSGGGGVFTPNANSLNAQYEPTASEIASGSVTLTLTSTGNGLCNSESDDVTINILPGPIVNAGVNLNSCANAAMVTLAGSVSNAGGGEWSGGLGTFSPDAQTLNATYTPTLGEIAAGSVILTLSSTSNGLCLAETDVMTISIAPSPVVNAGTDGSYCANNSLISLNGSVSNSTGGIWSGGAGTYSPNASVLNATYQPSEGELLAGSVTLTLTSTGNAACVSESDDILFNFTPSPTANAGADITICENNADVVLIGSVTVATGGTWSAGGGVFTPTANSLNTTYNPTNAELTAGSFMIYLTTTGNANCNEAIDSLSVSVIDMPTITAGSDLTSCSNDAMVQLGGSVNGASGVEWTGGTGTFSPDQFSSNAVYEPSAAEIAAGGISLTITSTGNGLCNSVSDQMAIVIIDEPTVDAGAPQTLCSNNADASLNGTVIGAGGGQWSGGSGVFSPNSASLNTVYSPTPTELSAGSLMLYLTSTLNGNCVAVQDSVLLTFTPAPTVDAGSAVDVCANLADVTLSGAVTIATGGMWSGGTGIFSPNANSLNTVYTPSMTELADGSVTLYLTTTGSGNCIEVMDSILINIDPVPIVNSGPDQTICKNNNIVSLGGFVGNATGGIWSGGAGTFFPSNASLSAQYTPTAAELAAGTLIITLTSTGNATCAPVTDDMVITFSDSPVVDAGVDMTACMNSADVQLSGNVLNASGVSWSGGTGSFSPSTTVFNPTYTPTASEMTAGSVTLTLTSTGNGNCIAVTDQVTISFTPSPVVNAGLDFSICENDPSVTLSGSVVVATGGTWSGGLGTFAPDANALNASYQPTPFELASGSIILTLTTTGNGNCLAETDQVTITVLEEPTVIAGDDQTICVDNLTIPLDGTVNGVTTTGSWATTGTGSFFPNNSAVDGAYIASSQDSLNGTVTLTLTSTNNGLCLPVQDDMVITLLPAGTADAGADIVVCEDAPLIQLNGLINGNATVGTWTTTGSGTFSPNANALNASYTPTAAEIAAGSLSFTLTVNSCDNHSDDVMATITTVPVVSAGGDQTVCVDELNIVINGSVSGSSATGDWETLGSGTFLNGNSSLNNIYQASSADSLAQGVHLVLHATNIGTCEPVSDTLFVQIYPAADVDAGPDMNFCSNNVDAQLNGILTGTPQNISWTSTGSGTFLPSAVVLNPAYIPSAADTAFGSVTLTLSANNSCNFASDDLVLTLTPAPYVDAGPDQTYCETASQFDLTGVVSGITTAGFWTTTGTGVIADPSALVTTYEASPSDVASGQIDFFLTSQMNGNCNQVIDAMSIFISDGITAYAGADQQVCIISGSAQLNPVITNGSPEGIWTTTGTGTFVPSNTTLNAEYIFSSADITSGGITLTISTTNNGTCAPATDDMFLTFGSTSFADAGLDMAVCANSPIAVLNGTVSGGALGGFWSSNGSGFFDNNTNLTATYTMSQADINNGGVEITLTTVTDGTCESDDDMMVISVDPVPFANAGADMVVCTAGQVQLNANVNNASSVLWSTSGTGSFFDETVPNTLYYPSASDSISGSVTLTVLTVGSGECMAVSDEVDIIFGGGLTAAVGADVLACSDDPNIPVSATLTGTTTGVWTTSGTGVFDPSPTELSATYIPGTADFVIGTIDLVMTTTNNQGCNPGRDTLTVTYNVPPSTDAGSSVLVCAEIEDIQLAATVQNQSSFQWTSSGTGSFDADDILNAVYSPTVADSLLGQVTLYITAVGLGDCGSALDSMQIDFAPLRVANAGEDIFTCADGNNILMNASFSGSGGGVWSTSGNGSFSPGANDPNATYTPSNTDLVFDQLEFVFTTTGNSGCPAATDTMYVIFEPLSTADAGPDQTTCDTDQTIQLNGSISNAPNAFWTTTGLGTFVPDEFDLQAVYQPDPADEALGIITFALNTTGISACAEDQDEMMLAFVNPLNLDFTVQNNCSGQEVVFTDVSSITAGNIIAWNWDFGNGQLGGGAVATTEYATAGQYNVTLEVFALNGCSALITETIDILEAPVAGISFVGNLLENEVISFIDGSFGATDYIYDFDDGTGSQESDPQHIFSDAGQYLVSQTVTNASGCSDETTVLVSILSEDILAPKLPNAFSPNGDGENDIFYVRGGPFATIHMEIYNGWGELIFASDDPLIGWDGTVNGNPEQVGAYVYTATATTVDGREFVKSGTVALIR